MVMTYPRRILDVISRLIKTIPVVILEGPRTVGKSTLLREIAATSSVGIIDLDEPDIRQQVEADPQGYVTRVRPVLVDEYPKMPRLLEHIKAQLNKDGSPGQFVLTGSASLEANRSGLGALVGRYTEVLILPLAQTEIDGRTGNFMEEAFRDVEDLRSSGPSSTTRELYMEKVLTGGFPLPVRSLDPADRYQRFTSYIDQSINYGMSNLYEIREREYLKRLLHRYAAQTGQLLNIRGAARDVELKRGTAENYTRLLELLFMIHRLPAWKATDQGPVSRPKLYVVDSGVGGRLLRLTEERVRGGEPLFLRQYGHLLETFVLGEVRKLLSWMSAPSDLGYWRNRQGDEVDLVVERLSDDAVIGMEVKAGSRVTANDWRALRMLRKQLGPRFRAGLVMYTGDMPYRLDEGIYAMPIDKLWGGERGAAKDRADGWRLPVREAATSGAGRSDGVLTTDGDPLSEAVRSATREMIDRMNIGEAAYWEVGIVPAENIHFGDFYTRAGVAGKLHSFDVWSGGRTEPIGQCVAVLHEPRRSVIGHDVGGFGALIHPLGSMAFIIGARENPPHGFTEWGLVTEWADGLVRFAHNVLSPHSGSWIYWSAGRRFRSGRPRFSGNTSPVPRGELPALEAVVDDPPHKGIPRFDDPRSEAFLLTASFYEWFGIPAGDLPGAG